MMSSWFDLVWLIPAAAGVLAFWFCTLKGAAMGVHWLVLSILRHLVTALEGSND
jgi:hypothetical protein